MFNNLIIDSVHGISIILDLVVCWLFLWIFILFFSCDIPCNYVYNDSKGDERTNLIKYQKVPFSVVIPNPLKSNERNRINMHSSP